MCKGLYFSTIKAWNISSFKILTQSLYSLGALHTEWHLLDPEEYEAYIEIQFAKAMGFKKTLRTKLSLVDRII